MVETYVELSISVRISADRQCFGTASHAGCWPCKSGMPHSCQSLGGNECVSAHCTRRPIPSLSPSNHLQLQLLDSFFPQSYIPYIYWLVFSASTHTTKLYVRNLFLLNLSKLYMNEGFFAVVLILHVTSCSILW